MKDVILTEIRNMKGSLLGIGIDDTGMLDAIENNDNIDLCYILSNNFKNKSNKKFKLFKKGRTKKVNIKKLRKYFHKKSVDNLLCNYNIVKKFRKSFIPNSIYINKNKLFLYGDVKDLENLKNKYLRYTDDIKTEKSNNVFLLIVNNKNTKSNIFKDMFFALKDLFIDLIDYLTDFLIN